VIVMNSANICRNPPPSRFANGVGCYGRANLRIPAHKTRTVLVAITQRGLRYLRRHGRDRDAFAAVALVPDPEANSFSGRITLLPPR
jgi:hypothetical protein